MKLRLLAVSAVVLVLYSGGAAAQDAPGCDGDGDKPCATANVVNSQARKDALGVDQRLVKLAKNDTSTRAKSGKPPRTVVDKSKSAQGAKAGAKKHKHKRKSSTAQSSASRAKPNDTVTREPKRTQR